MRSPKVYTIIITITITITIAVAQLNCRLSSCKMKRERVASLCLNWGLILSILSVLVSAAPRPHTNIADIVMVEDIVSVNPETNGDTNVALITLSESNSSQEESGSSSKEDTVSDDLIFLTHKTQIQPQTQTHIDVSASEEVDEEEEETVSTPTPTTTPVASPIDMSPFIALIPTRQVQQIVSNYYRNDAEVQRAYGFLNSGSFAEKKQQLIQLPEVLAFTRYLNASGLDVLKLVRTVVQTISPPSTDLPSTVEDNSSSACNGAYE